MLLDRHWIEAHIPHQGGMCLLDEVLNWDERQARCRSATHRSAVNPLRAYGRLGATCGIEYAAQTMAVHGALMSAAAGKTSPPGLLASIRGFRLHIARLDQLESDLIARVERVAGDDSTALYEFSLTADEQLLLSGRAAIAFDILRGARL